MSGSPYHSIHVKVPPRLAFAPDPSPEIPDSHSIGLRSHNPTAKLIKIPPLDQTVVENDTPQMRDISP